ncbi:ATP-binding cassette domain-containing protein, partial [Cryobacterium sp. MLB-32]|uniref:ATP-binding cassette domain-containing protein n=1 Tax=Cryobacterium sp. MLB-32 TaxID=1529318 RepID=UPI00055A0412
NLRFFARLSGLRRPDARIHDVLGFLDFTDHDNQRVGTFSKGMRQRVGIAQAILHSPAVLFLDEPTSGLDPEGVRTLRETVVRLNREFGMTIFMNTHLLSEVTKTCTSIGILNHGRLVHHDSLKQTLAAFPANESLEDIYFQLDSAAV